MNIKTLFSLIIHKYMSHICEYRETNNIYHHSSYHLLVKVVTDEMHFDFDDR